MRYRHVGDHIEDLDDGRSVTPGEYVDLDEDQLREPRAEELVAVGKFIPAEEEKKGQEQAKQEATLAKRRVSGRSKDSSADNEEGGTDA